MADRNIVVDRLQIANYLPYRSIINEDFKFRVSSSDSISKYLERFRSKVEVSCGVVGLWGNGGQRRGS
jgi:hypothetical protein